MMEALRRRLRWMHAEPRTSAFAHRVSGTMQSTARPLQRLLERVKGKLTPAKPERQEKFSIASTVRTSRASSPTTTSSPAIERLHFCLWRGVSDWTVQRRYLYDEGRFAWVVVCVTSAVAWTDDGIRPGDVLETVGGESLAFVTRQQEVLSRLKASPIGAILRFRVRTRAEPCRVQRFFVVVDSRRPIGASIAADGVDSVAVVIDVAEQTHTSTNHVSIRRGDILVEVNGERVVGWPMPAILALVAKSRPHMTITFQRWTHTDCGPRCRDLPPRLSVARERRSGDEFHDFGDDDGEQTDDQKAVVLAWRSGPLGLTIVKDDDARMPCVNRLTGKGSVHGIERLRVGSHLASINGRPTHARPFRDVLRELQTATKPLWLVFLPPDVRVSLYSTSSRDDTSDKRSSGGRRWSSSSSLLSLDESWDVRSTKRFTSTVTTTMESEDE